MNTKFAKEWIAALRSGKYKQCRTGGYYSGPPKERSYCCLGLGAHLLETDPFRYTTLVKKIPELEERVMSESVSRAPLVSILIQMNDGDGEYNGNPQSFDQIADYLERVLHLREGVEL